MKTGRIALDTGWRVITEYRHNLETRGQPGVGSAFLKWVLTNHRNPTRCSLVEITPKSSTQEDYEEFPRSSALRGFDPSDRKFVAVACAHEDRPPILEATDTKWWTYRRALSDSGVVVDFLCPQEIRARRRVPRS